MTIWLCRDAAHSPYAKDERVYVFHDKPELTVRTGEWQDLAIGWTIRGDGLSARLASMTLHNCEVTFGLDAVPKVGQCLKLHFVATDDSQSEAAGAVRASSPLPAGAPQSSGPETGMHTIKKSFDPAKVEWVYENAAGKKVVVSEQDMVNAADRGALRSRILKELGEE